MGIINKAYLKEFEGRIHKLEKLGLTNIKIPLLKKDAGNNTKQGVEGKPAIGEENELKLEVLFREVPKAQCKLQSNFYPPLIIMQRRNKY